MESLAYLHTALAYEEPQEATTVFTPQLLRIMTQYKYHEMVSVVRIYLFVLVIILSIFGLAGEALAKNIIRKGSQGQDVSLLQQQLAAVGIYHGPINGKFGSLTESAVKRFQSNNGLQADGIVGSKTWLKLEQYAISGNQFPYYSSPNQVPVLPDRFTNLPTYYKVYAKVGDSGYKVKYVQEELKFRGFYQGKVDGIYGLRTEDAVKSFQASRNVSITGMVDEATLRELQQPATGFELTSNQSIIRNKQNQRILKPGDSSQAVSALQSRLRELGYNPGSVDGNYGFRTQDAVASFQRNSRIRADGIAGIETLRALGLVSGQQSPRYVVVIPDQEGITLDQLRRIGFTEVQWQDSSLGRFINAGEYNDRGAAEQISKQLRNAGFDARVTYSNN